MKKNRDIDYINKDFNDYRSQLINFSQTYFPDTYSDFSETSPGMMFMEQASYVGDVLSFYLDNQIQENFLQTVKQENNLYELAYMYGYKPNNTYLSTVSIDVYQLLPAKTVSGVQYPDYDYALYVEAETTFSSNSRVSFILEDSIDFSFSSSLDPTTVSVAQVNNDEPTYYLLKKSRKVTSGNIQQTSFTFSDYKEFPTVEINTPDLGYIQSIVDSNGNKWYEVDYLAQELVFDSIKNNNINDPNNFEEAGDVPYILKTKQVQRRFCTRKINPQITQLQFGSGKPGDNDEDIIPNPDNVGLGLPSQKSKLTTAYSPNNFIFTNTYGIAPSNTSLTVTYVTGGGLTANVDANTITSMDASKTSFIKTGLNSTTADYIFQSLSSNNPEPASGGKSGDTAEEIRQNTISNLNSQLRNVTADDYLVRALSMPPNYGTISKGYIQKPKADEGDATLDMYILSYTAEGKLTTSTSPLKKNLKTYLNQYKMIGDSINIKDGFIINVGCEFEIITLPNYNNNKVLIECITSVQDYFKIENWQINQPIIIRNLSIILDRIEGVQTVKSVKIINKTGTNSDYSKYAYDIDGATQNGVVYPSLDPSIFEVKFPNTDIKGKIVTL